MPEFVLTVTTGNHYSVVLGQQDDVLGCHVVDCLL